jgi:hypothetical protein
LSSPLLCCNRWFKKACADWVAQERKKVSGKSKKKESCLLEDQNVLVEQFKLFAFLDSNINPACVEGTKEAKKFWDPKLIRGKKPRLRYATNKIKMIWPSNIDWRGKRTGSLENLATTPDAHNKYMTLNTTWG